MRTQPSRSSAPAGKTVPLNLSQIELSPMRMLEHESEKGRIEESCLAVRQMEALRDNLTPMIVHDLRGPLSSVVFYSHLVNDELDREVDKEVLQHLAKIRGLSERLTNMVDTILDVSRLENESMFLSLKTNLRKICSSNRYVSFSLERTRFDRL